MNKNAKTLKGFQGVFNFYSKEAQIPVIFYTMFILNVTINPVHLGLFSILKCTTGQKMADRLKWWSRQLKR